MIPVEGNKHLYRDENSGAIINCDTISYNQYIRMKEQKKLEKLEKEKLLSQKDEIDKLKEDVDEIKSLLKEIINGSLRNNSRDCE
jgi:hypothetical protein